MFDYVIAGTVSVVGIGVASRVIANRLSGRSATETTAAHRRPRGHPPDPVLRLALETASTRQLGLDQTRTNVQAEVSSKSALESHRTA
ncbi:hypothetical protein LWC34_04810 [Kibdelosporangium philippinense]|uniref:Uncharacterized protein n=1 Tax=Kibdelosporangium philippinense TaxID=211113 RepID=A0ABS8Z2T0_9PSEU|nr:hypothetical protein [Kibdelosporangium philippinense]MCE7002150.1 hypothetical protein [Kibdelosporangium philippinense]